MVETISNVHLYSILDERCISMLRLSFYVLHRYVYYTLKVYKCLLSFCFIWSTFSNFKQNFFARNVVCCLYITYRYIPIYVYE